jgi:hypothetical protein
MKNLSRREFLRISALAAAGAVTAQYANVSAPALAKPPAAEPVTLDCMSLAEYEGPYKEVWSIFEEANPDIKINTFSINEDTAAAYEAKVAGGYLPAIELTQETQIFFKKDNYEMAVDLSTVDFKWWDRWVYDVKSAWPKLFNLPGPRSLDVFQGYVITWQYNSELMDEAGLDPQRDVKTWSDMEKWLDEGTKWAKSSGGKVDWFWNQAWHNWGFGVLFSEMVPLAWQDGSRQRLADCWMGKAKFNAADSPYRHYYEFYLNAKNKGWIAENTPSRVWEGDMEASYIAGKSVMMLHGPWVWDKALAAGSEFAVAGHQKGLPPTPPADGGQWLLSALPPNIDNQWWMREGEQKLPSWPQIVTAWNWFWSPEAVPLKAQAEGRVPLYKLDEPLDLKGPQYQQVLKQIGQADGPWPQVKFEQGWTGMVLSSPYRKKGSKGVFDWESNGNDAVFTDLFSGKITVQQALDVAQKNWEESFEGLPEQMPEMPSVPG